MSRTKNIILVIGSLLAFCVIFSLFRYEDVVTEKTEYVEIKDRLKAGADPQIGISEFKDGDFRVDESFVSHLPLVIIETDSTIPDAYKYDFDEERFVLQDGVDPYVTGKISVINNASNKNCISDKPETSSFMRIKYRGNSSIVFDKHQYRINLTDKEGNNNSENILGMGEETDWILNISMMDESLLRNYMVYSICSKFMDYTPDVRFCEVIVKNGEQFEYEGLYLMMEVVEQGKDRVDIAKCKKGDGFTSYLLRRDRYDEEGIMLDTYATRNELCYGYLDVRYPKADDLDEELMQYISEDISAVEKVLFSEDEDTFLTYTNYLDEDTFVDYFVINEFFTNYDAGNNSTYLYKDKKGKLCIGPVWDYDNAADNQGGYLLDPQVISFEGQTWFPQLLQSEEFCKKLEKRYKELRDTYFSDKYINNYIDDTVEYLGKAQQRDWSRWYTNYTSGRFELIEDRDGIIIDRNFVKYEDVVQRLKDVLNEHAIYIGPELQKLTDECRYKDSYRIHYEYAALFMVIFLSTIAIGRRKV